MNKQFSEIRASYGEKDLAQRGDGVRFNFVIWGVEWVFVFLYFLFIFSEGVGSEFIKVFFSCNKL